MEYRGTHITYKNWRMIIAPDGDIVVQCDMEDGEVITRCYNIPDQIREVHQYDKSKEYVHIYVEHPEISFYQFKFEEGNFLVGDTFQFNGEHLNSFASYVFGEDN